MQLYYKYLVVGGMPGAVADFIQHNDFFRVRQCQAEIEQTYIGDMALHAPKGMAVQIRFVWQSLPAQLSRESTKKFKYSDVEKNGREAKFREPLAWLESAGLVNLNYQTSDVEAPIIPNKEGKFFKVYICDTGLMFYKYNLDADAFLNSDLRKLLSSRFRGALAENYVKQALEANKIETYYWTRGTNSQTEVEFITQNSQGWVIPIEVKSGENVRSRSFNLFREKSNSKMAIRISSKNFGFEKGIFFIPLYATFCIRKEFLNNE